LGNRETLKRRTVWDRQQHATIDADAAHVPGWSLGVFGKVCWSSDCLQFFWVAAARFPLLGILQQAQVQKK
jgi:hypothetical protein